MSVSVYPDMVRYDVDIENWGWKYTNDMSTPITMNQLPALDNSMQMFLITKWDVELLVNVGTVAYIVV